MVVLKNISRINNNVVADCYIEGREKEHFYLEIDALTMEIVTNTLGEMNAYVFHARQRIKELVLSGKSLPSTAMSMWY